MKRKIIIALLMLLLLSASGVALATYYMSHTTTTLGKLVTLHQIEDLRQHLIISIQSVQSDLYTVNTLLGNKVDSIADNVIKLENSARECSECHHEPVVAQELDEIETLINDYQNALSYYITASSNKERIESLKLNAAAIGNTILKNTEAMSLRAAQKLEASTSQALDKIKQARIVLFSTICISFFFGVLIAIHLIQAVTGPIKQLVTATSAIARGDLDHSIVTDDTTEFGKLASHFNAMSTTLKENYESLVKEVIERKQMEIALRDSEERYALAARGANDGLWDLDLRNEKIYYSYRWKSMLGYKEDEIDSSLEEWLSRVHELDRSMVEDKLNAHIEGKINHFECEYRIYHKDKSVIWVLARGLAVRDENGKAYRLAGSQADITGRKRAEEQMLHDAFHDHLTGLPNRALFVDRLEHVIESSKRDESHSYAVLFTDLDRFKTINDSLGHDVGDKLLIEMGQRLKVCLRPGDTVARLGGDEFAVLLDDIDSNVDIEDIARRIEEKAAEPFHIQGHELFTSQSVGIAIKSRRYDLPEIVLRDADIAMYQAKANGGGQHVFFDSIMHATIIARNQLERELRSAVDRQEDFVLHYQPIVNMKDLTLSGFEALIRWNHNARGLVPPNEFIPLAEETGLIIPLSTWILRQACRQLRVWHDMYSTGKPIKMSVNISSKMLLMDDFVESVSLCLDEEKIPPESLAFEITENVILEHTDLAMAALASLQKMGVHIHIDDFGTGYSSLSYLHKFPANALKIDRSFISKMSVQSDELEIVKTIVALAHNLELDVIAEGLELEHQVVTIQNLECAYGQGFFFSKGLPGVNIPAWISENNIRINGFSALPGASSPEEKVDTEQADI